MRSDAGRRGARQGHTRSHICERAPGLKWVGPDLPGLMFGAHSFDRNEREQGLVLSIFDQSCGRGNTETTPPLSTAFGNSHPVHSSSTVRTFAAS